MNAGRTLEGIPGSRGKKKILKGQRELFNEERRTSPLDPKCVAETTRRGNKTQTIGLEKTAAILGGTRGWGGTVSWKEK